MVSDTVIKTHIALFEKYMFYMFCSALITPITALTA